MATDKELSTLDRYLDPLDHPEDYNEYDRRWDELSDLLYEQTREDEILEKL